MHKQRKLCVLSVLTFCLFVGARGLTVTQVVGKKPVVQLKKIFKITDTGGEYYFKYPSAPVIDAKGYIYLLDNNQLLKFDNQGNFVANYFKLGQGPGEATQLIGVVPKEDRFIAINIWPHKLITFTPNKKQVMEIRFADRLGWISFLTFYKGRFYFLKELTGNTKAKAVFVDVKVQLRSVDKDGSQPVIHEDIWFPKKYFRRDQSWAKNVHFVQTCCLGNRVLIANNGNYSVKKLDLDTLKLKPFIEKEYKKVIIEENWREFFGPFTFPEQGIGKVVYKTWRPENLDDIMKIWCYGSKIWLVTSTFDEKARKIRIDAFTSHGKLSGTFYLEMPIGVILCKLSWLPATLSGERLYIFEWDEEENYQLGVYRLVNIPKWAK